jgi:vacuolar-type H+-ATPase subunit D/Vma8
MTRFRAILRKVDEAKRLMGRVLQLASFSLAEVTYTTGDIGFQVQESVRQASYTVRAKQENVSGVVLPAFEGVRSKEGNGAFMHGVMLLGICNAVLISSSLPARFQFDRSESRRTTDPEIARDLR